MTSCTLADAFDPCLTTANKQANNKLARLKATALPVLQL
jgi:hypothetical protein